MLKWQESIFEPVTIRSPATPGDTAHPCSIACLAQRLLLISICKLKQLTHRGKAQFLPDSDFTWPDACCGLPGTSPVNRPLSLAQLKSFLEARRQDDMPRGVPDKYLGVWQRSLLETPESRDSESIVYWLQTRHWHADLRIPANRPDFSGIASLADCNDQQLAWLATQQGFCGLTQVDDGYCTWHRLLDFQPASGRRDIGHMAIDAERIAETGVNTDYLEIWNRLPRSRGGTAALELVTEGNEPSPRPTWLLVAGDCFIYVRGRSLPLPGATDLSRLISQTRPSREQLMDWLDVEISFGYRYGPAPWRIEHSTLPFREGRLFTHPCAIRRLGHQLAVEDNHERRWMIRDWSMGAAL
jgi:hypothetical protein